MILIQIQKLIYLRKPLNNVCLFSIKEIEIYDKSQNSYFSSVKNSSRAISSYGNYNGTLDIRIIIYLLERNKV
jgi:hypothetical protein